MQLKRHRKPKTITWKSFILLFIILAIAGVLKAKQMFFDGPEVPTADVPAVSYDEVGGGGLEVEEGEDEEDEEPGTSEDVEPNVPTTDSDEIPDEFNLAVPFTSQAPFGVWDAVHEDTCEEASFLMAMEFFNGTSAQTLDPTAVDEVLYDMVDLETSMGMEYSITAAESVEFLDRYTDEFDARVIENPTANDIKELVAKGYPVIVPAAGRELGNPFFTGAGPLYHMLVIRGYTETTFITNDPGTRQGRNYTYTIPVIMEAMGDWEGGNPHEGAKRVIIIEPK